MTYIAHINDKGEIQTCTEHCTKTAAYSSSSLKTIGLENSGYITGLTHDTGKFAPEFEEYITKSANNEKVSKGSVIHTFASVRMLLEEFHTKFNASASPDDNLAAEIIAITASEHHGQYDLDDDRGNNGLDHRMEKQPDYDAKAIENFYRECINKKDFQKLFMDAKEEIEKICQKCNNIALKNTKTFEECNFYLGVLVRLLLSATIDGDRKDTASFMSGDKAVFPEYSESDMQDSWEKALIETENTINGFEQKNAIDRARKEMSDFCAAFAKEPTGIYRLSLPTGAGKTLSGLRYALSHAKKYKKKRIIFTAPLLSIIDQNSEVIRNAIKNDDVILEHYSDAVVEEKNTEDYDKNRLFTETWDTPVIITTLYQLLCTMFDGKTSSIRRFHSLCDSVIVIDEVQSLPLKMLSMFNLMVNFLSEICNVTFVLCSATQPAFDRDTYPMCISDKEFIPKEKLKEYQEIFKRNELIYKGSMNIDEMTDLANECVKDHNSVLIVCNTKSTAKTIFSGLKETEDNCFHLSTSMCMAHRKKVLKQIKTKLENDEKVYCVSTQLIEAGVDISFGSAIRIMAGLDNVIQTAGRCNRNGLNNSDAPVYIVSLKQERLSMLEEIQIARNCMEELAEEYKADPEMFDNDLASDQSIKYYYRRLAKKYNGKPGYTQYTIKGKGIDLVELLSTNRNYADLSGSTYSLHHAFKTAGDLFQVYDSNQISVVVPYGDGEKLIGDLCCISNIYDIQNVKEILNKLKEYTVNIYRYQFDILQKNGALYNDTNKLVTILKPGFYDLMTGITCEKENQSCNMTIL